MRHFAVELEELNQAILEMGALVESTIHCTVQSLVDRDERMARRVIEDEQRINQMELDVDARVTRLLALPSCEVLEVARAAGGDALLVPLVSDAVRGVDLERRVIDVDLHFLGEE